MDQYRLWASRKESLVSSSDDANVNYPYRQIYTGSQVGQFNSTLYNPNSPILYNAPFQNYPTTSNATLQRLGMLQIQNRILKAKQQNTYLKQQLGIMIIGQKESEALSAINNHSLSTQQGSNDSLLEKVHLITREKPSRTSNVTTPNTELYKNSSTQSLLENQSQDDSASENSLKSSKEILPQLIEHFEPVRPIEKPIKHKISAPETYEKLTQLTQDIESVVQEHNRAIDTVKSETLSVGERKVREKREAHENVKKNIENLLKLNASSRIKKLPLWRHKLNGIDNPPPEAILSSKGVFRAVSLSILVMIISPRRASTAKRLKRREAAKREFSKTLRIITESIADYIGKIVSLPVTSIVQDGTLNFDPKENLLTPGAFKSKMIQIKVRVKSIVDSITRSAMPTGNIMSFLITLIEDENYFPDGFFWGFEASEIKLDALGATRDIAKIFSPEESRSIVPEEMMVLVDLQSEDENLVNRIVDGRLAHNLLINILLVKVLIGRVILSPWHAHVCGKPANRLTKRVIYNLRVIATVLYHLVQRINPVIPTLSRSPAGKLSTSYDASSASGISTKKTSALGGIMRTNGTGQETANGQEELIEFKQGSLEFTLLEPRSSFFDSVDFLHSILLRDDMMRTMLPAMDEWFAEFIPPLNDWLKRFSSAILKQLVIKRLVSSKASVS